MLWQPGVHERNENSRLGLTGLKSSTEMCNTGHDHVILGPVVQGVVGWCDGAG